MIGGGRKASRALLDGAIMLVYWIGLAVSVTVDTTVVDAGDDRYVEAAWELKERIRREEDVLKQRKSFFKYAYTDGTCHLILIPETDELVAFATTRSNGYLLFLAVSPDFRDLGFGRELVSAVADQYGAVTCHARVSNEPALEFYDRLGFEIIRRINNYYEDGGDAYYLRLGDKQSITSRIIGLFSN